MLDQNATENGTIRVCKRCRREVSTEELCPICGDCPACCPWESLHRAKAE